MKENQFEQQRKPRKQKREGRRETKHDRRRWRFFLEPVEPGNHVQIWYWTFLGGLSESSLRPELVVELKCFNNSRVCTDHLKMWREKQCPVSAGYFPGTDPVSAKNRWINLKATKGQHKVPPKKIRPMQIDNFKKACG